MTWVTWASWLPQTVNKEIFEARPILHAANAETNPAIFTFTYLGLAVRKKIALMTMQTRNKYKVTKVDGVELLGNKFTKS